jgi:hypothetical protein
MSLCAEDGLMRGLMTTLALVLKLMGPDYYEVSGNIHHQKAGSDFEFANIVMRYEGTLVYIQISNKKEIRDSFEIIGSRARIMVTSPWLKMQHFVFEEYDGYKETRHFSYNVAAGKLRFAFLELKRRLSSDNHASVKFDSRDNVRLLDVIEELRTEKQTKKKPGNAGSR